MMLYEEGMLLRFEPFYFKNGALSKPKYFVVLKYIGGTLMMASLPTSKDHIPTDLTLSQGCVNDVERDVNAYVFDAGNQVTTNLFAFPRRTFIYAEQVDEYGMEYLNAMKSEVIELGKIKPELFQALIDCLRNSKTLKRKYRKLL